MSCFSFVPFVLVMKVFYFTSFCVVNCLFAHPAHLVFAGQVLRWLGTILYPHFQQSGIASVFCVGKIPVLCCVLLSRTYFTPDVRSR